MGSEASQIDGGLSREPVVAEIINNYSFPKGISKGISIALL
jgi:hypothetical protein